MRLTELAARAELSLSATSELVNELEHLGYLHRIPDPRDGRAKLIVPTDRGHQSSSPKNADGPTRRTNNGWLTAGPGSSSRVIAHRPTTCHADPELTGTRSRRTPLSFVLCLLFLESGWSFCTNILCGDVIEPRGTRARE